MEKINWINGQAGGTPLSAENLNRMQDNIEKEITEQVEILNEKIKGTVLYENANGDNGETITLSDSISNYDEVNIDYVVAVGDYKINEGKRTQIGNGNCVSLTCFMAHSDALQLLEIGRYLFSGNTLTRVHEARTRIDGSGNVGWDGVSKGIYITKVTGYKY